MDELIEHGLNEFMFMVFNIKKMYEEFFNILKLDKSSGQKFTALNYYNCLKNKFYTEFYENKITRNLLAFNGDITQYEKFKDFDRIVQDFKNNR